MAENGKAVPVVEQAIKGMEHQKMEEEEIREQLEDKGVPEKVVDNTYDNRDRKLFKWTKDNNKIKEGGVDMSDEIVIQKEIRKKSEVDIGAMATNAKVYIDTYVRTLLQDNAGLNDAGVQQQAYDYWLGTVAPTEVRNDSTVLTKLTRKLQNMGVRVTMPQGMVAPTEEDESQPVGVGGGNSAPRRPEDGQSGASGNPQELPPIPDIRPPDVFPPWDVGRRDNVYEINGGESVIKADMPKKQFGNFVKQFEYAIEVWKIENTLENFIKFLKSYKITAKLLTPKEVDEYNMDKGGYSKTEDNKVVKNPVNQRQHEVNFIEMKKELRQLLRPNISKQELEDKIIDIGVKMEQLPEGEEKKKLQEQIDILMSDKGMYEWYEASRKNNFQKRGRHMSADKIVKEGSVGKRGMSSFMESFVGEAQRIVTAKPVAEAKTVVKEDYPERMLVADAEVAGFFRTAKSCGWGKYAMEPLDGGEGGVWFTEKAEDGKDYLVKSVTQEGEVVRRFKEKQASLQKKSDKECPACNGTGWNVSADEECFECKGEGKLTDNLGRLSKDASLQKKSEDYGKGLDNPTCSKCFRGVVDKNGKCPACGNQESNALPKEASEKEDEKGEKLPLKNRFPNNVKPQGAGFDRKVHDQKMEDWKKKQSGVNLDSLFRKSSEENKDRGVFTVYTKKPADTKGSALGEKEAKDKKEKGVFDIYKSKPAGQVQKEARGGVPDYDDWGLEGEGMEMEYYFKKKGKELFRVEVVDVVAYFNRKWKKDLKPADLQDYGDGEQVELLDEDGEVITELSIRELAEDMWMNKGKK